jgi:hypothetical protein
MNDFQPFYFLFHHPTTRKENMRETADEQASIKLMKKKEKKENKNSVSTARE